MRHNPAAGAIVIMLARLRAIREPSMAVAYAVASTQASGPAASFKAWRSPQMKKPSYILMSDLGFDHVKLDPIEVQLLAGKWGVPRANGSTRPSTRDTWPRIRRGAHGWFCERKQFASRTSKSFPSPPTTVRCRRACEMGQINLIMPLRGAHTRAASAANCKWPTMLESATRFLMDAFERHTMWHPRL